MSCYRAEDELQALDSRDLMTVFHSRFVGREQGSRLMALALLLLSWTVLAWPWLSGAVTIPWDAKAQFLPQLQFLAASFAKDESPFWAPYVFSGVPQIADPQSLIFSPPFVLLALLDPTPSAWAADVTLYLMVLVSAAALYFWLTDKGWHAAAGLLAAIAFAFGAAMAWRIQHIGQVMSLAYLPITLLCLDRALTRRSLIWAAAAGIAAALLVLGRDQIAMLCVYFLIAYVIAGWLTAESRAEALRNSIAPLAIAALVGLIIVTLPVLMTALYAASSNRPSIDFYGAGRGSLHPALLLTLFAPDVFGASGAGNEYWGPPSHRWPVTDLIFAQNMGQMYIGALPVLLLIYGAVTRILWRPGAKLMTAALLLSLIYALGWFTPAFKVFHALVPGVDLYRRPADSVFMIGFFGSVASGFVLNEILLSPAPRLTRWQKAAMILLPTAAFSTMYVLASEIGMTEQALPQILIPAAVVGVAAVLLVTLAGRGIPTATAIAAVAAFMTADLAYATRPGGATGMPPGQYDALNHDTAHEILNMLKSKVTETRSETRRDRVELVGLGFHLPNAVLTHELESTLGYNPLRPAIYTAATGAGDAVGLTEQKNFSKLFPSYRSRIADLLGLRYIATSVPIDQIDKKLAPGDVRLLAKTAEGFVYENPRALPRVMFASSAVQGDFASIVGNGIWPDVDPEQTVVLERPPPQLNRQPGSARISAYHNTRVELDVDSPDGGYLVLNDMWHPWWFAERDGTEVPILKANVLFRAVEVPPGRHTITMTFSPLRGAIAELAGLQTHDGAK